MSFKTSFKDGRLGIGLDVSVNSGAPKYPLDINGDIRLTGAILKGDGTIYTSGSGMGTPGIVSNQTDGVYKIGINNITPTAALDISGDGLITGDLQLNGTLKDSNGDPRIFSNWTIHSNGNDLYRPSGNVGIGTTSPGYKLEVSGGCFASYFNTSQSIAIGSGYKLSWGPQDSSLAAIEGNTSNNGNLYFMTNGSHRMHINPSGNVGIGTTNVNYKLYVNGNTYINGTITAPTFSGSLSGTATYTSNVHVTNFSQTSGSGYTSQESQTHKIVMIDKGGDGGWKNTGQLGVHNESDSLRYNINSHTLYANTFSGSLSGTATYTSNVHVTNKNGVSGTYKMMFCNSSGWQNTSNIMCDDDSSNGPRYNPSNHTLTCNTFNGSLSGTATWTSNVHVTNFSTSSGSGYTSQESQTHKLVMIDKGGDGGWKNTGQLGVHNESNGLRYNINTHTLYAGTFSGGLDGQATYTSNVHVTNFSNTSGNSGTSEEAQTHKLVMIDKGGDGGWKNTGQLGVHNESDGLRYNINEHTLYLRRANMDRITLFNQSASYNSWKISVHGGVGIDLYTGQFTTPGNIDTYYRCEFPGPVYKWGTLWVGRGTHTDSSWRGAFAFKIMYHGAGYGHFNSGEWRVLGYDNDTRVWIAKTGDSFTASRLYLWLRGASTYYWAGDNMYHATTSSSDTVTSGTMPSEWDASVSTSDDRIKHNEKKIDGLKIINQLNPIRYFKTNKPYCENFHFDLDNSGNPITDEPYTIETGLIAQEVRKIPELEHLVYGEDWYDLDKEFKEMRENGEDIPDMDLSRNNIDMSGNKIPHKLQLRYKDIFVYNIAATQELSKEVDILKKENQELKDKLAKIEEYLGL